VLIALAGRKLTWSKMMGAARSAVETTTMIMIIVAAASLLTYVLGLLRVPGLLSEAIAASGLSPNLVLIGIAALYIFLGCFIESISLVVLTIPILVPALTALKVDLIWFGVFVVLLIEIALLTPPVGLNLYVLKRVPAGQTLDDIIIGSIPFIFALIAGLALLMIWPGLATWLPSRM
jgi:TRAP-type C4-dicarboxylate transport system permease large subunit